MKTHRVRHLSKVILCLNLRNGHWALSSFPIEDLILHRWPGHVKDGERRAGLNQHCSTSFHVASFSKTGAIRFYFCNPFPVTRACSSFLGVSSPCIVRKQTKPSRQEGLCRIALPVISSRLDYSLLPRGLPEERFLPPIVVQSQQGPWPSNHTVSHWTILSTSAFPSLLELSLLCITILRDCACSYIAKHLQRAIFLRRPDTLPRTIFYNFLEMAI